MGLHSPDYYRVIHVNKSYYICMYITYNILFWSMLDLAITKLSLGMKIHSKPHVRKLIDT